MAWAWAGFFANYIIIDYMYRYMVETWVFQEKKNYRILTYVSAFDDYTFYHQIKILIGFGISGN